VGDDKLSTELRKVEEKIDYSYRSNPLFTLNRPQALWYLLSAYEEHFIREINPSRNPLSLYEETALADNLINQLKWPVRWIYTDCPAAESYSPDYSSSNYGHADRLLEHAYNYLSFESAFTYASWGLVNIELKSNRIIASAGLRVDTRYDAYDRIAPDEHDTAVDYDFTKVIDIMRHEVIVKENHFTYRINKKIVNKAMKYAGKTIEKRFSLPPDWKLTEYSLGEYGLIIRTLWVISAIHFYARVLATWEGCIGCGYSEGLVTMTRSQLIHRLIKYTGLSSSCVSSVVNDLTYGSRGISNPDPPLQPLFEIVPGKICWPPNLILTSAAERNLMVLLNRFPEGRKSYSRISRHRETLLQDHIKREVKNDRLRFKSGKVSGWGKSNDIDLAIISDVERCCLLLELKSFIGPADPRELKEKSEEIAHGINQIVVRRQLAADRPENLYQFLKINQNYNIFWGVASETSVGGGWVQHEMVPVIRVSHLIEKLNSVFELGKVCKWFMNRDYLPAPNSTYVEQDISAKLAGYTLDWYGVKLN